MLRVQSESTYRLINSAKYRSIVSPWSKYKIPLGKTKFARNTGAGRRCESGAGRRRRAAHGGSGAGDEARCGRRHGVSIPRCLQSAFVERRAAPSAEPPASGRRPSLRPSPRTTLSHRISSRATTDAGKLERPLFAKQRRNRVRFRRENRAIS